MTQFTGQAVYRKIVDDLRERIHDGRLRAGEQLPSIADLMHQYGVSQTVVKAALAELKSTGEIYGHQGKGTFVQAIPRGRRVRRIPRPGELTGGSTFAAEMRRLGLEPHTELAEVGPVVPPPDIAERLRLGPQDQALVRKRHMYGSQQPVQLATAYIPMSIAGDTSIAFPDAGPTEMYRRLGERGHRPVRFEEEVEVRHPTPDERAFLGPVGGLPVLVVTRVAYDHTELPIEAATNVLAAYRWSLRYEWHEDLPDA